MRRRYEAGEFDNASEALAAYKQPPPLAQGKFGRTWAWKFKSDWGHLDKETNTHGVFMEPQDAQMVNMRDQENARLQEEKIQHCLLLIYDQLWKKNYRGKNARPSRTKGCAASALAEPKDGQKGWGANSQAPMMPQQQHSRMLTYSITLTHIYI